ncbi:hypothetical protein B0G82_6957 [Paraburkholderia sp. BL17N1]|nr:hypothetical protein B0G82_6957 [Paraburkholderia sp. BL17N1]
MKQKRFARTSWGMREADCFEVPASLLWLLMYK